VKTEGADDGAKTAVVAGPMDDDSDDDAFLYGSGNEDDTTKQDAELPAKTTTDDDPFADSDDSDESDAVGARPSRSKRHRGTVVYVDDDADGSTDFGASSAAERAPRRNGPPAKRKAKKRKGTGAGAETIEVAVVANCWETAALQLLCELMVEDGAEEFTHITIDPLLARGASAGGP